MDAVGHHLYRRLEIKIPASDQVSHFCNSRKGLSGIIKDAASRALSLGVPAAYKASGRVRPGHGKVRLDRFVGSGVCPFRSCGRDFPLIHRPVRICGWSRWDVNSGRSRGQFFSDFPTGHGRSDSIRGGPWCNRTSTPEERRMCRWDSRWAYRVRADWAHAPFPASGLLCTAASNSAAVPDQTPFRRANHSASSRSKESSNSGNDTVLSWPPSPSGGAVGVSALIARLGVTHAAIGSRSASNLRKDRRLFN